jgi:predicted nucleic acid-binding Zn ribbon protein
MLPRAFCQQCRLVFDVDAAMCSIDRKVHCPACNSTHVAEAPPWAPLGSGANVFDTNVWEYECQQCSHKFTMPIPRSPSEDKSRRCPVCNGEHLHLLTRTGALPLYCG